MRRLATGLLSPVLAATGVYFVLYLYGWEWYRAFVVGVVFVAAEVSLVSLRLTHAIDRASARGSPPAGSRPGPAPRPRGSRRGGRGARWHPCARRRCSTIRPGRQTGPPRWSCTSATRTATGQNSDSRLL